MPRTDDRPCTTEGIYEWGGVAVAMARLWRTWAVVRLPTQSTNSLARAAAAQLARAHSRGGRSIMVFLVVLNNPKLSFSSDIGHGLRPYT